MELGVGRAMPDFRASIYILFRILLRALHRTNESGATWVF
jgi:hypothetical protein